MKNSQKSLLKVERHTMGGNNVNRSYKLHKMKNTTVKHTQIPKKTSGEGKHLTGGEIALKSNKRELLPKQSESQLQKSCVRWFRLTYPKLMIFAIPNGGKRNIVTATIQKAEGVLPGVADLQVLFHDGKSLFIEMKTKTGQTDNQKQFEQYCIEHGHKYMICKTLDEFMGSVSEFIEFNINHLKN